MAGASDIDAIVERVPELHDALSITELEGGLTNTNYKVETDGGAYVVRVYGKETGLLAIDRENEYENTVAAAEVGVGAPVVAYLRDEGALVLGFVEGRVFGAEDVRRDEN